ncbi:MAG: glycosyltransferase family 2 protein, partial [Victivallales bacterium]|nr:glycosyltransferase family 2 protein [Victivallales bacterium]
MNVTPRFSIITPVYKVEKYLKTALDSLQQQTFPNWECICIDDGSPDSCGKILDEYAAKDSRFVVIHQKNGGLSAARNRGLEVVRGEYVTSLDGDDLLHPRTLELCDRAIRRYPGIPLLLQGFREFEEDSLEGLWDSNPFTKEEEEPHLKDCRKEIPTEVWFHWYFWSQLWRRDLIQPRRYRTDISLGEDRLLFQTALEDVPEVIVLPARLYGYRLRNTSLSHSAFSVQITMQSFLAWQLTYDHQAKSRKTIPGICLRRLIRGAYLEPVERLLQCPKGAELQDAWKQY